MAEGGDHMIKGFAQGMETALQQAGAVARMLQGRVSNEGKYDATDLPGDDEALRQMRAAKTLADEVVQEILLVAASSLLDKLISMWLLWTRKRLLLRRPISPPLVAMRGVADHRSHRRHAGVHRW